MSTLTRLECIDKNGDVVGVIPRFESVSWLYELGQDGGGSLKFDALDTGVRQLIRDTDMVRIVIDNVIRAGIVLRKESSSGTDRPSIDVTGPGPKGLLSEALVYPSGGLNPVIETSTRRFDWTEPYMDSSRMTDTVTDQGTITSPVTSIWDPKEYDDTSATWIWVTESGTSMSRGTVYLRRDFSTASEQMVVLQASVDNKAAIFIDGIEIMKLGGNAQWLEAMEEKFLLPSGSHTIAIRAWNHDGPAGVVCSLMGTTSDGEADSTNVIVNTETTNWVGTGYPARTPGMFPGEIINMLLNEAQARGAIQSMTTDTTDTAQSGDSGVNWATEYAYNVQVGDSMSQALDQLHELGPDIWVTGDPTIQAVDRKGTNQSSSVFIRQARDATDIQHDAYRTDGNAILVHNQADEWSEHTHSSTGDPLIGRREFFLRAGTMDTDKSSEDLVNAAFESHAIRIVESVISFRESSDSQPHVAFELGDDVSIPSFDFPEDMMSARVLAIRGEVTSDTPQIKWQVETQETQ